MLRIFYAGLLVLGLSACAGYNLDQGLQKTSTDLASLAPGGLSLSKNRQDAEKLQNISQQLLDQPLGEKQAIELMLAHSPGFQVLLAQHWALAASAAQSGRLANPSFALEQLVGGNSNELNRYFSFGLLDVLTLPQQAELARHRLNLAQIRLTADVVDQLTRVRQSWVTAVAAAQLASYADQVRNSAQASAELAQQMEQRGNFNQLTKIRHQAFYAEAQNQWQIAQQTALSRREELVRLLGLDEQEAPRLKLPDRLPDLPDSVLSPAEVSQQFNQQRLDIQQARAAWLAAAKAQGLNKINSLTDVELTLSSGPLNAGSTASNARRSGLEVSVKLPVFDAGDLQRDAMNAKTLAAAHQLENTIRIASSALRQSYSAYRTAYEVARHYRDVVIPLRKSISDENLLRYNGMLIGVFELLADSREQIAAVMASLTAQQQFWLAQASLQSNLIGRPAQIGAMVIESEAAL